MQVNWKDLDTNRLQQHALERHASMLRASRDGSVPGKVLGAYGRSTPRMHEVGLAGEYALVHWLTGQMSGEGLAVHLIGDDPAARTNGDVAVVAPLPRRVTCEVKTSRESDWQVYARTLDAAQLARCTADAYVWAVLVDLWGVRTVRLMGWLPVSDIRAPTAAAGATRPASVHDRPHVRVHAPMHRMSDLPRWAVQSFTGDRN